MSDKRLKRLNSLLKEVISEVIQKEVRHPDLAPFISVTQVEISKDLHYAKVSISVIGTEEEKEKTIKALTSAAGFIGVHASKKVVMRYFPQLTFKIDRSVDDQMNIERILNEIKSKSSDERDSAS